jgi:hypothetical protein
MDQSALKFYFTVEDAGQSAANWQLAASNLDAYLTTICEHFEEDLDQNRLQTNFAMLLPAVMDGKTAETRTDIITDALLDLGPAKRLYGELVKLVVLIYLWCQQRQQQLKEASVPFVGWKITWVSQLDKNE